MHSLSNATRKYRASQEPVVGGLPDQPGILAAMALSPKLGEHLRGIAHTLLFDDFPGSTLTRTEREIIAARVSIGNGCCFCGDSHLAFARRLGALENLEVEAYFGDSSRLEATDPKLNALIAIAERTREDGRLVDELDVTAATVLGASDGDVHVAVLIAAAFSMFNRMVDGLRARTPASPDAFSESALRIAEHGYVAS